ncbi:dipeptide ABC transporter ATP-binding protein [Oceanibacterium hippocampi]|uniref:Glutathione import ATP-binding protein GsiA n=1 Tax=Oceanibacterium hippocampi TaxID=745714 RepID=A0A1Y5TXE9_9PROT|nr:ABC transporter ATP-binding protein [Oceanibacterium hippocampi]SLN70336.1 Glutathione import ATP-binding protein GsiA [Oceanibacterium hippocampi]
MNDASASTGTGTRPILDIRDLCISYFTRAGEIPAVVDFSLKLAPGESVGLVGESGCGKSTVAMAIMRYLGTNGGIVGGSIEFDGRDLTTMAEEDLRRIRGSEIAMIYQEPMAALNPSMRIGRQLMEVPLFHENVSEAEAEKRAIAMLEDVNLPDAERVMEAYPHQISGGQQQRVVIAMALLSNPKLLLLDEPTTALDVTVEAGIVELIADISKKFGTSMLYISHNLGLILETCDRVCVMYSGEVVEEGTVNEVFDRMRHPYTHGLFNAIPLPTADKNSRPLVAIRGQLPLPHQRPPGCFFGPRCDFFVEGRCDAQPIPMTGMTSPTHRVRCIRWEEIDWDNYAPDRKEREPHPPGEIVLQVEAMRKYYPVHDDSLLAIFRGDTTRQVKANESLSFSARKQETVAIVGESGCGKSTFAKVLTGLETATDGKIIFGNTDIGQIAVGDRTEGQLSSLQMVFQNPNDTLNPSQTVGSQIARVIRKFGVESDPDKIHDRVMRLLDLVKLPRDFALRRPRQLSGGQKQRIGIARAFAGNPSMVIADEPVSALDVSVQAAVTDLLMDIQEEFGTTLLFISHDLSVVRYLADRIVVMYLGQIMERGSTDEVFSPPYHPYTEALLSAVPIADTRVEKKRIVLEGQLPSVLNPPKGCPFHTRCPRKIGAICENERPPVHDVSDQHKIACHIPLDELKAVEPVFRLASDAPSAA